MTLKENKSKCVPKTLFNGREVRSGRPRKARLGGQGTRGEGRDERDYWLDDHRAVKKDWVRRHLSHRPDRGGEGLHQSESPS